MKADDTFSIIAKIYAGMNAMLAREMKKADLDGVVASHGSILALLFKHGELPMNILAERIGKTPQTVTVLVQKLAQMGYVETRKSDTDRRATIVSLTGKGAAREPLFNAISEKLYIKQYAGLSREEVRELRRLLNIVAGNFADEHGLSGL